tara:strand:+ start:22187 stop:22993 length:807 start_codon:yes stop_codon:yes gene_type:complete
MMKIEKSELERLLRNTQRMCNINGKPMPQVVGCVIECHENEAYTTNIVRDGKTSVSSFSIPCSDYDSGRYVIPDIAKALGVLKAHRGVVRLEQKEDKLIFKSSNKQTTISADSRALAFPHTKKTIAEWHEESLDRMACIDDFGNYTMASGEVRKPIANFELHGSDLRQAIEAGNINGQKVNRCAFWWDGSQLDITTGKQMLGETTTRLLDMEWPHFPQIDFEFEGGLENCLPNGKINIFILDFTPEGQGYSMVIYGDDGSKIFQRGVM